MRREYSDKIRPKNYEYPVRVTSSFFESVPFFNSFSSFRNLLLSSLFKIKEGIFLTIQTNDSVAFKNFLMLFKNKSFVESFGENYSFNDYPKTLGVSISFYIDKKNSEIKQYASSRVFVEEGYDVAFSKAFGEALERHSSYYLPSSTKHYYPKTMEKDMSFLYRYIPKFTRTQIENNPKLLSSVGDLKTVKSIKVSSVLDNKSKYLPFDYFYWGDSIDNNQRIISPQTTSGCGGGLNKEQAVLSALYESIERDHFFLYWLSGVKPNIIFNKSIGGTFGAYIQDIEEKYHLDIYFLDLRFDTKIPVCACVIVDPVLNLISLGGKACSSGLESLQSSFLEALSVMTVMRQKESVSESELSEILKTKSLLVKINRDKRLGLYNSQLGIKKIKEFFLSGESIDYNEYAISSKVYSNKKEELSYMLDVFKNLKKEKGDGYEVYLHRFDSLWLREAGYFSVKVYIPSFLILYLHEKLAMPVSNRLVEFATMRGKIIENENDINPLPHFFP